MRLKEIPERAYVVPAKNVDGGYVEPINPCSFGMCKIFLHRDRALLEVMSQTKFWELDIAIGPFMDIFEIYSKRALRPWGRKPS